MKDLLEVKYGSGTLTCADGVDQSLIDAYAQDLSNVHNQFDLIVTTSGAVAAGRHLWQSRPGANPSDEEPSLQSLAGMGSPRIFTAWQDGFKRSGLMAAAIPITHREIEDTSEGPMLLRSLQDNRKSGLVTILNENDAVSDVELARLAYGGENDGLASHIARAAGAVSLIIFTKKGGIFDDDGREIRLVEAVDHQRTLDMARQRKAGANGRGGLYTKVLALVEAAEAGINAHVAAAGEDIQKVLAGEAGTHFIAKSHTKL